MCGLLVSTDIMFDGFVRNYCKAWSTIVWAVRPPFAQAWQPIHLNGMLCCVKRTKKVHAHFYKWFPYSFLGIPAPTIALLLRCVGVPFSSDAVPTPAMHSSASHCKPRLKAGASLRIGIKVYIMPEKEKFVFVLDRVVKDYNPSQAFVAICVPALFPSLGFPVTIVTGTKSIEKSEFFSYLWNWN